MTTSDDRPEELSPNSKRQWLQMVAIIALAAVATAWAAVHFVRSAPPRALTIATGPKDSTFERMAKRYVPILARNGIKLTILETDGSLDNLKRLEDPKAKVDIAFVQSGLTPGDDHTTLNSLGSMFYEPMMIFYRGQSPMARLSELEKKRVAIGPEGSGTEWLALALLKANGIEPKGTTQLMSLEGDDASKALVEGRVDAIFLSGDSASVKTMRELMHEDGIRLFEFAQADGYVRRFPYLSKLEIPAGAFDLGEGLPKEDIHILAPTVEMVARTDLHPALSDLLLEAAFQAHRRASLLQSAGQFPNQSTYKLPISADAGRYYKSGDRSLTYRYLPFWMASFVNRILVSFVPVLVLLIPAFRLLPQAYNWRINRRINQRYGEIAGVERQMLRADLNDARRDELLAKLDTIEKAIVSRKLPGSHAEQVYILRRHIDMVRKKLAHA